MYEHIMQSVRGIAMKLTSLGHLGSIPLLPYPTMYRFGAPYSEAKELLPCEDSLCELAILPAVLQVLLQDHDAEPQNRGGRLWGSTQTQVLERSSGLLPVSGPASFSQSLCCK